MPFPFLPGGAILGAAVLIGALTAFGLLLRALDGPIAGVRDTAVTGLVAGWRTRGSGPMAPAVEWPAENAPSEIIDLG